MVPKKYEDVSVWKAVIGHFGTFGIGTIGAAITGNKPIGVNTKIGKR